MQWYKVDTDLRIKTVVLATSRASARLTAKREIERLLDYLYERGWAVTLIETSKAVALEDGTMDMF